jgi:hypothetical protein
MRPHPRIRTALKWSGIALSALLLTLWARSYWLNTFAIHTSGVWASLQHGGVTAGNLGFSVSDSSLTSYTPRDSMLLWWFSLTRSPGRWTLFIPFWFVLLFALTPTALALHLHARDRRRARRNFCLICNYNRAGIPSETKCPECGSPA